eukprot:1145185-Pelagomonas_calceolata.AAC.1
MEEDACVAGSAPVFGGALDAVDACAAGLAPAVCVGGVAGDAADDDGGGNDVAGLDAAAADGGGLQSSC